MDKINNIKCTVRYNGAAYNGWQIQSNDRSIQEEIELALFKIAKEQIRINGSGRTDKGVHAIGQVFNFKTKLNIEPYGWKKAFNHYLPKDIYVTYVEVVDDNFHARFSCKEKTYEYLLNTLEYDALTCDLVYQYNHSLDVIAMQKAAKLFLGTHDFEHFCSNSKEEVKDFIKTIYSFKIRKEKGLIKFRVNGSGFLRYQVRMMVGALIEIGAHKKTSDIIKERLDKKEANTIMYNAPSNGLYLVEVKY